MLLSVCTREQGIVQRESTTEEEVIERNQQGENLKYCKKCRSIKPDRAHHCRYVKYDTVDGNLVKLLQCSLYLSQYKLFKIY